MKKLLITGGSGLLASNWAYLAHKNYKVLLGLHHRKIEIDEIEVVQLSLNNIDKLYKDLNTIQPDIVINTAAITSIEKCEQNYFKAKKINTEAASNIANICELLKIKLVHISTDHIFSGESSRYDEEYQPKPVNNYAKSKYQGELKVRENNPSSLVVRTNFYGWGPKYRQSFSDFIINQLRASNELNLYTDVFYTPIIIDELVSCVNDLLHLNESGVFNIVGSERISKYEFGIRLAKSFNLSNLKIHPITYKEQKNNVRRPQDMSLSNTKLISIIGREVQNLNDQLANLKTKENSIKNWIHQ